MLQDKYAFERMLVNRNTRRVILRYVRIFTIKILIPGDSKKINILLSRIAVPRIDTDALAEKAKT